MKSRIKAALICPTIGQTRRGYEVYFSQLFEVLKPNVDVTMFKGAGQAGDREKVVRHFSRTGLLSRMFPDRYLYARYLVEFASFGVGVAPFLAGGNFDIVHFIDPPLARYLHAARRVSRRGFRLLFSNARPAFFDCSRWADHIHCISPAAVEEAEKTGVPGSRLSMIPVGIDSSRVKSPAERDELRRQYNVSPDQFVVLSVTTVNRAHKRVDYLIDEMASAGGDAMLWIDGSLHPDGDPALLQMGSEKLGSRFRHTHVPSNKVGELLQIADLFVSSAVIESFGMAVVEAMSCGLPVVTHDSPHFRWLTNGLAQFTDMTKPGSLAGVLGEYSRTPRKLGRRADLKAAAARFDWQCVGNEYLKMYGRALQC